MHKGKALALCGGVGGAKLALGLSRILSHDQLTIVINTGDDFTHLGLRISPDIDTVTYTLSGLSNTELGWGRAGETWQFMSALKGLGGEDWFNLGDLDLAMHVERSRRLKAGDSLSAITADFAAKLGIKVPLVPMTDDSIATIVETTKGALAFQHYFVRDKCEPKVKGIRFSGAGDARPSEGFRAALADRHVTAIVICPSNPFLSVDPLLAIPGVRKALRDHPAPVVAVSPIVGGRAIKGPTAKMMGELGLDVSATSVAAHYGNLLDGFVVDSEDGEDGRFAMPTTVMNTIMNTMEDREGLARAVLEFAARIRS
ncbi:MAG: 2-phospho-L-lactate transferase [Proteobacteria bacterium]|nr:2-phospho-L-lactate transferase [Pseudomonadota bacterium]